jgi:hypothetical protein
MELMIPLPTADPVKKKRGKVLMFNPRFYPEDKKIENRTSLHQTPYPQPQSAPTVIQKERRKALQEDG